MMVKKLLLTLSTIIVFAFLLSIMGCAGIIPPNGGPKDTIPPVLVTSLPKDSALNVKTQKLTLTFDEFVDIKDISENVIFSPLQVKSPIIDHSLKNITIKFRDTLQPNTTYSIDFGHAIRDINEGNILKNFSYVFSTGDKLAMGKMEGKVKLAETGTVDSSLIVILHKSTDDSAIYKKTPIYIAKLNGSGEFKFNYIQPGKYNAYVLPNDYSKKYDDSTKLFGFLDSMVNITKETQQVSIYAYQEFKKKDKPKQVNTSVKPTKEEKKLKYSTSLDGIKQDLLSSLKLTFSKPLRTFDSTKIILCDSFYTPLTTATVHLDTSKTMASINYNWLENSYFKLLVLKESAIDTSGIQLLKGDTLSFTTKNNKEYGSIKIKFSNLNLSKHPVLQIVSGDKIEESIVLKDNTIKRKLFKPGDYSIRLLLDANHNGVWDAGSYKKRIQPEIVLDKNWKMSVKADWDNETEIRL